MIQINAALLDEPDRMSRSPYDRGWVCLVQPTDLAGDLSSLRIGQPVVTWFQEEIGRLREAAGPQAGTALLEDWGTLERSFLKPG